MGRNPIHRPKTYLRCPVLRWLQPEDYAFAYHVCSGQACDVCSVSHKQVLVCTHHAGTVGADSYMPFVGASGKWQLVP